MLVEDTMTPIHVGIWGASRSMGQRLSRLLREEEKLTVTLRPGALPPAPEALPQLLILFGYPESLCEQVEVVRAAAGGEQVVLVAALADRSTPGSLDRLLRSGVDDLLA